MTDSIYGRGILCLLYSYKPPNTETNPTLEDPTPDYMNLLGMIFSMCGLMLKVTSFSLLYKNTCLQSTVLFTSRMLTVYDSNMSRMIFSDDLMFYLCIFAA